ncbi:MAG: aminotransferase class IV [Bacteroidetes bacterium]|nr:aminotransferase class IV [Bacteroidota bacterium]MDA0897943.1 aminotransferase class IV [Bacteroidota bacterium]
MINFNTQLQDLEQLPISALARAARYGDGVFETIRMREGKLLFIEDHYFRLMASMRILRMSIPMEFTPEFIIDQSLRLAEERGFENGRLRLQVVRSGGGTYTPTRNTVDWWMELDPLEHRDYVINDSGLTVDLFKDHYVQPGLLSTLKSSNALPYVLGSIYAKENDFDAVLLVNDAKKLVEANYGNVFLVQGNILRTSPLEDGALRGVFRKNVMEWAKDIQLEVQEASINPFDLQKADELWITNTIRGIEWVGQYRKKSYSNAKATEMMEMVNRKLNVLGAL